MGKPKMGDTYYHIKLVPKHCELEQFDNDIDVYLKGENLKSFIADVFPMYHVKIYTINHEGFIVFALPDESNSKTAKEE